MSHVCPVVCLLSAPTLLTSFAVFLFESMWNSWCILWTGKLYPGLWNYTTSDCTFYAFFF